MSAYPTSPRAAFLEWCQTHTGVFSDHAAEIGLTAAQATAFASAVDAAAAALLAQEQAQQAAQVATQVATHALGALRASAGDAVRLIRAFAASQDQPLTVYNLARLDPPAPRSPAPPPAQPTRLTAVLRPSDGALLLRWKASNPAGTSGTAYLIRRKLPGASAFAFLGVSGRKEFVDETLPAGTDSVQYTVQGQRAESSGPLSAILTVNFGAAPGGAGTAQMLSGVSASTVDGQVVRKVLPTGNGRGVGPGLR